MKLHDLFESLFGSHATPLDTGSEIYPEDDQDTCNCFEHSDDCPAGGDDNGYFWSFGNIDDMFRHFHGDMRQQMDEMHRQMDDIFKHIGSTDFPSIDGEYGVDGIVPKQDNTRDNMLKQPDNDESDAKHGRDFGIERFGFPDRFRGIFTSPLTPKRKIDEDISDVHTDDIAKLYDKPRPTGDIGAMNPHSHYSRVSVRVIRTPDGTVQEERTVCDSEGHCETTKTTRSPSNDVVTEMLPAHTTQPHDNNSYTGMLRKFRNLWPWQRGGDLGNQGVTDESVYDSIFGKK